jgi:hypothetical protein
MCREIDIPLVRCFKFGSRLSRSDHFALENRISLGWPGSCKRIERRKISDATRFEERVAAVTVDTLNAEPERRSA